MISDKHITTPHERVKVTSVTWLPRSNSWIRRVLKFILWASSPFRVVRERACERAAQPRGSSSRVSFCVVLLRDLWRYPPKLPRSLSNYTCPVFRLILFFGTRSENVLESRNLIFLNEFMALEKCDPHSQTQRKNSSRNSHSISNSFSKKYWTCYYIPESARGQDEASPAFWLATEPILLPRDFPL